MLTHFSHFLAIFSIFDASSVILRFCVDFWRFVFDFWVLGEGFGKDFGRFFRLIFVRFSKKVIL